MWTVFSSVLSWKKQLGEPQSTAATEASDRAAKRQFFSAIIEDTADVFTGVKYATSLLLRRRLF